MCEMQLILYWRSQSIALEVSKCLWRFNQIACSHASQSSRRIKWQTDSDVYCRAYFPLRMVRANQTNIQIPFTFWKISWLIFAQVSVFCILSSSSVVGNGETEGLPLANSRRKPVRVRYGDFGWRILTPRPSHQVESGRLSVRGLVAFWQYVGISSFWQVLLMWR